MVHKEVSKYMADLARKRKDNRRGFNMPEVQRKAQLARKAKKDAKDKDRPSGQVFQSMDKKP